MRLVLANYGYSLGHCGGGEAHIEAFIREARQAGHTLAGWPELRHPEVTRLPTSTLGIALRLRRADVLYTRLQNSPPVPKYTRWFSRWGKRLAGNPLLVWEFNTVPEQGAYIGLDPATIAYDRRMFRQLAPQCDLAVCVSQKIADYVVTELDLPRAVVISNGAYPRERQVTPADSNRLDVVWAGSAYIGWNDFDLLLAGARLLQQAGDPVHFHLVGPGTETLRDVPANVRAHGPMAHHETTALFDRMGAAVCLYRPGPADFSSPLKFFDYSASGIPTVSTPHPQMDALHAEAGTTELVVSSRSPQQLAEQLRQLLRLPDRRRGHGLALQSLVTHTYNWPTLMARLFAHLQQALARRRG
ncbi:glycosyltransferase [Opitutus sp. ER46]|uniref:glycosyltransferase n=1 Tax=Opitutus sp. ER46 TaxID=2161864 RepID=UPI000D3106FB|nr:glycosyltransferase [Opitutus sp. ER46]PTX91107.1 hypothetical protein DB354_20955 [Opitutus sp. ER46]